MHRRVFARIAKTGIVLEVTRGIFKTSVHTHTHRKFDDKLAIHRNSPEYTIHGYFPTPGVLLRVATNIVEFYIIGILGNLSVMIHN